MTVTPNTARITLVLTGVVDGPIMTPSKTYVPIARLSKRNASVRSCSGVSAALFEFFAIRQRPRTWQSVSEHLIEPTPDHGAHSLLGPEADGLRDIDPERGAFEEGEQRDVDPQADAHSVDHRVPGAVEEGLADVVENGAEQVLQPDGVVEQVAVDLSPERVAPFERR